MYTTCLVSLFIFTCLEANIPCGKRDTGSRTLYGLQGTWIQGADLVRVELANEGDGLEVLQTERGEFQQLQCHQGHDNVLKKISYVKQMLQKTLLEEKIILVELGESQTIIVNRQKSSFKP